MAFESTANLLFSIAADTSDAEGNIARFRSLLSKDLDGIGNEIGEWSNKVFGSITTLAEGAAVGFGIFAAGALAVGAALESAAEKGAEYAERIERASKITGIGVEDMSALRFAAEASGVNFDGLVNTLARFEANILKANDGSEKQAAAFARLGITQDDVKAGQENLLPLILKMADRYHSLEDGVGKTAMQQELMARGGKDLITFLSQGAEYINELCKRAREMGMVMNPEDILHAKQFGIATREMKAAQEAVDIYIAQQTLPLRTKWAAVKVAFIETLKQGPEAWANFGVAMAANAAIEEQHLQKLMEMSEKSDELKDILPPPAQTQKATEEFRTFSTMLETVKDRSAGLADDVRKTWAEASKLNFEVDNARERFEKLAAEGKISAETLQRETAALAQLPAEIARLATERLEALAKKKAEIQEKEVEEAQALEAKLDEADAQHKEKVLLTAASLNKELAAQDEQTYDRRRHQIEAETDLKLQQLRKDDLLTEENEALILQIRKAGLAKIDDEQGRAFQTQLEKLQAAQAKILESWMTEEDKLGLVYQTDLQKYSENEESKVLVTARTEGERAAIRQQFAANRKALDDKYEQDLNKLHNSQGWQGVFGDKFAQAIRGNEQLSKEWAQTSDQGHMMVSVSLEALKEEGTKAFEQLAQGMGASAAEALVYEKSVG